MIRSTAVTNADMITIIYLKVNQLNVLDRLGRLIKMSSKIEKMYPMTQYPFDHNKRYCRVCRRTLLHPSKTKWRDHSELHTMYYEALCSIPCLLKMHKANEDQLDLFLEWGDWMLNEVDRLKQGEQNEPI
jgi:hypothetical protein